jgi:Pentapeptide repeats (8 copies)
LLAIKGIRRAPQSLAKQINDVRTTLLQALAGGVLALGAYFTYRQLRVTREGQITDRYTKAVDQLGHDELDVRLGGIYALERIARDSPPDRATIEEVLTAFVRGHAPWPVPPAPPSLQAITQRLVTLAQRHRSLPQRRTAKDTARQDQQGQPDEEGAEPQGPTADVQAAMTVLSRRQHPPDGLRELDLTKVDLRRAELARANLQGAALFDANLQRVMLAGANLQDVMLARANLQGAVLFHANLQGAELAHVDLQGAAADEATRWPDGWDKAKAKAKARGVRYSD